jgi:hypothetical protein
MRETGNAYTISVGKPLRKHPFGRLKITLRWILWGQVVRMGGGQKCIRIKSITGFGIGGIEHWVLLPVFLKCKVGVVTDYLTDKSKLNLPNNLKYRPTKTNFIAICSVVWDMRYMDRCDFLSCIHFMRFMQRMVMKLHYRKKVLKRNLCPRILTQSF